MPGTVHDIASAGPTPLPRPTIDVIPAKRGYPLDGGDLDLLVRIAVELPEVEVDRKPLNLALVIDRSGSMSGEPLEAAKTAARAAVSMLLPGDWLAVATFDDAVAVPVPLTRIGADRRTITDAIDGVLVGGSTNLFAGWAEGLSQTMACLDGEAMSRVVLLSDGQANQGVTDADQIAADVARAMQHGVSTTTMGFGRHYDENLLRAIAEAGHGNYTFIEGATQVVAAFQRELAGISALRGRNVRLALSGRGAHLAPQLATPASNGTSMRLATAAQGPNEAGVAALPDLIAGMPGEHLLGVRYDPGAEAGTLTLSWDDALSGGHGRQEVELPLEPLDAATFEALPVDPRVSSLRVSLEIAGLKEALAAAARRGDRSAAADLLDRIEPAVATITDAALRQEEETGLRGLRRLAHDLELTARKSEALARERLLNRSEAKLQAMFASESLWREKKLAGGPQLRTGRAQPARAGRTGSAQVARAGTGADPSVTYEVSVTRPHGGTATVQVVRGDIVTQRVDGLINSTNRGLFGVSGVDGAVHRRAGPEMAAATQAIGGMDHGEAVFTPGFALPARFVIHTAAPPFGTTGRELEILARCYRASFALAARLGVRSLAVPVIGTGHNGYPREQAVKVMVDEVRSWLTGSGGCELVRLVAFDDLAPMIERALLAASSGVR